MTESVILTLGGKPIPIDLHTVLVDAAGNSDAAAPGPVKFDFDYRDVRFAGQLDDEAHAIKLVGDVGPLPYSAESPAARLNLMAIVAEANDVLGTRFKLSNGRILFGAEVPVPVPLDAVGLIGAVANVLVPAVPYLELIAVMVRPPLEAAPEGEPPLRREWRRVSARGR